ncbi:hypothetical protein Y032_0003g1434 [Ancylostoma ceylanicum]|uniref:Uncharacterized protein n=1 Tax=Ancylostoma ceylanicum TaxID=53326 RepID=A0A016VXX0_9BILA|nr:hypothetical protein Y032_0003g1434 [Ancylostoma ceylanicum]
MNPASYSNESISRHRTLSHAREQPPVFKVRVVHRHLMKTLERKIMGVREIRSHQPEINTKGELRGTLWLVMDP